MSVEQAMYAMDVESVCTIAQTGPCLLAFQHLPIVAMLHNDFFSKTENTIRRYMRSGEQWCLTHVFELISISVPFLDPHPLPSRCYCRADSRTYEKGTLISRGRFFLTDHSRFSIFNPSRSRFLSPMDFHMVASWRLSSHLVNQEGGLFLVGGLQTF